MNFIEIENGRLLNTAFIREIRPTEELTEFVFKTDDDELVRGTIDHHDIARILMPVIPAEKGYRAILAPVKDGFKREWNHLPVLAWRVGVDGMEPVIPGGNKLHGLVGIIEPSGQVIGQDGTKYGSLTVFREEIEADDTRFLDIAQQSANDDVNPTDHAVDILPGYHLNDNPYPSREEIVFQVETTLLDRIGKELVLTLFCKASGSPHAIPHEHYSGKPGHGSAEPRTG
ncbi:hypothetical protein HED55_14870 [Ochrobactrum haematophilum]|uniref:Uncharacterized protein n=1 Tax=Brucella haematophila TaxID=419474 RepID=A0ABX1DNK8_9HYPH|nr:hypothetical protein [Brucella haematophila]